jgi:hypothetical protein
MPGLPQLPRKLGLNDWPVTIADFYAHLAEGMAADLIPSKVSEGTRCFLLGSFHVGEFLALFIDRDLIALANVEIVSAHKRFPKLAPNAKMAD